MILTIQIAILTSLPVPDLPKSGMEETQPTPLVFKRVEKACPIQIVADRIPAYLLGLAIRTWHDLKLA